MKGTTDDIINGNTAYVILGMHTLPIQHTLSRLRFWSPIFVLPTVHDLMNV